jgi:hypothetical protein
VYSEPFVGLILYLGKGLYFSIWWVRFHGRGSRPLKKIEKFITFINRLADELLSNDIYNLPKTTSVSFPFLSFLLRRQQHSIPSSIYGHLLLL